MRSNRFKQVWAGACALALSLCLISSVSPFFPPGEAQLPLEDRIRLAETFRIARSFQDRIWEHWSRAPFAMLLVTPTGEFLVGHPRPSPDFEPFVYDTILQTGILYRKQQFPEDILATFPAVGGVATIVAGQPENVSKSSAEWVISLLHEHFHQMQMSQPGYFAAVDSLGLAGSDRTGRWMLTYPFPYDSANVNAAVAELGKKLLDALRADKGNLKAKVGDYLDARRHLKEILGPDDYKYLSFQFWQEGVARWTELKMAELVAQKYSPTGRFRALLDFTSFRVVADSNGNEILQTLGDLSLQKRRRVAFYYLGAGEALLLDRVNPGWQKLYFKEKFFTEKYF